ncbi:MAG: ribonuclease III [Cyanobacteria bacterium J06626_6]
MIAFALPSFRDRQLWAQAMTHRSFANEQSGRCEHNERLEFLGDAILTFLSGEYLYGRFPQRPEGELTAIRAALVDQSQLCDFASRLSIGEHLRLGKGASQEGGRTSARLLCSAFEAMIGAYYIDSECSVQPVRAYVTPMFDAVIEQAVEQSANVKSQLQAWAQQMLGETPTYVEVRSDGPDHAKRYVMEVRIADKPYGQGRGYSKKQAEKRAARQALERIEHQQSAK